jgi:hypothetical protein
MATASGLLLEFGDRLTDLEAEIAANPTESLFPLKSPTIPVRGIHGIHAIEHVGCHIDRIEALLLRLRKALDLTFGLL